MRYFIFLTYYSFFRSKYSDFPERMYLYRQLSVLSELTDIRVSNKKPLDFHCEPTAGVSLMETNCFNCIKLNGPATNLYRDDGVFPKPI